MRKGQGLRWGRWTVFAVAIGVALAMALPSGALANTVLHVDAVHGADTGNCQSSPCKTLTYAITQGESVPDLVTIDAAPGTYTEDLLLGSKDSGLTITGAGSGTDPSSSTIIQGLPGDNTIETSASGSASALTLKHLRLVNPSTDSNVLIDGGATDLSLSDVAIDDEGTGPGIIEQDLTMSGGSISLPNAGAAPAVVEGRVLTLSGTPITENGNNPAIVASSGGSQSLTSSPVSLTNAGDSASAIAGSTGSATLENSAITSAGTGPAIVASAPITVVDSPITVDGTTGGPGIINSSTSGSTVVSGSRIDLHGQNPAVITSGGPALLTSDQITLDNAASSVPALVLDGRGSALSHVSVSGAWTGPAIDDTGSVDIADSTLTAGGVAPAAIFADGGSAGDDNVSITRSTLQAQAAGPPVIDASNTNLAIDSSELLGSTGAVFGVSGGKTRTVTIASSTIDAGTLGVRDPLPDRSLLATTDNSSGSDLIVNVEGSILVEAPQATVGGSVATSTVNCSDTEVPNTVQAPSSTLGAINCGTGANGNTFTSSLAAIFAHPGSGYTLNPSWSGVDSVPASAISLPAPFTDSSTDLLGNPRVLNGKGTCTPGLRDKGAIELTGHGGVVPAPRISGPSTVGLRKRTSFTGSAPNVPRGTSLSFAWHVSDGSHGSGARFTHTFTRAGTYTVSLTVNGATGCTASATRRVRVVGLDRISRLSISPKSFRVGPGAVVSYRGTEASNTLFVVQRPAGRRFVNVVTFRHRDSAGRVRFRFTGRIGRRTLSPGSYRLELIPSDPAGNGPARFVSFTITG